MAPFMPITSVNAYPAPAALDFTATTSPAGGPIPSSTSIWTLLNWSEVTPICPLIATQCSNPLAAVNGVAEALYYQDYHFNASASGYSYTIASINCCRNTPILSGATGEGIGVSVTIQPRLCNSSPVFSGRAVPYFCAGQTYTFDQAAFDPDGDSLVYSFAPCTTNGFTSATYTAPYSDQAPLGPYWDVSIDAMTGDISFLPDSTGPALVTVLCVKVEEYRNGVKIGPVVRDMQITVINCGAPDMLPTVQPATSITGATAIGTDTLSGFIGMPIRFYVTDRCRHGRYTLLFPHLGPLPFWSDYHRSWRNKSH